MSNRAAPKPQLAPRNPLVAAARFLRAGAHRPERKRERQAARRQLAAALRLPDL